VNGKRAKQLRRMGRAETGVDEQRDYFASAKSRGTMVNDPMGERAMHQALKKAYKKAAARGMTNQQQ